MSDDIASLGFAVDSGPLVQGSLALKHVSDSADDAADSSKKFGTATQQAASESQRAASVNDQLSRSIKTLSSDVERLASAMNDNARATAAANDRVKDSSKSYAEHSSSAAQAGRSILSMASETLKIAGYLKLAAAVAFNASPALRGVVDNTTLKTVQTAAPAFSALGVAASKAGVPVAEIGVAAAKTGGVLSTFFKVFSLAELALFGTHMKAAGLGAQALTGAVVAMSPALRGALTHEVVEGVEALPTAFGKTAAAAKSTASTFSGVIGSTLAFLSKIAIPVLAVAAAWEAVKFSVTLANERIEKSVELLKKSNETGVGVDLIQRVELSAKKTEGAVESLIETMKKFNEVSKDKLEFGIQDSESKDKVGVSSGEIQKRLDELVKLGNFLDNASVKEFQQANTVEEKYRAVIKLIATAGEQGERLAALNLASTFASPQVMENLKANVSYLQEAQERADKISATKLISAQDVAYATNLKKRLEEAQEMLHEKWLPTQNILVDLGLKLKEAWIKMVESVAIALDLISRMVDKATPALQLAGRIIALPFRAGATIAGQFISPANGMDLTNLPESGNIEDRRPQQGPSSSPFDMSRAEISSLRDQALPTLTSLLLQQKAINQAGQDAVNIYTKFGTLFEKSKLVKPPEKDDESAKAWDREVKSIEKHNAALQADALAVGMSEAEHASLRAETQLLRAAEEDGIGVTKKQIEAYIEARKSMTAMEALDKSGAALSDERKKKFEELTEAAKKTTDALEHLKIANDIKFAAKTVFLNQEEVTIAEKLKKLYPDVGDALRSPEAAAMRFNNAMRDVSETTRGFVTDFVGGLTSGKKAIDAIASSLDNLFKKLASMAANDALNALMALATGNFEAAGFYAIKAGVEAVAAAMSKWFADTAKHAADASKRIQEINKANENAARLSSEIGGSGSGSILQKMNDVRMQVGEALAQFHGVVTAAGLQLFADENQFFRDIQKNFLDNWESTLSQLGDNSAFSQATANVATLAKTIQDFVNNTRDLGTSDQTFRAQTVGRQTLLALLATPKTLSATQQELERIRGTAAGLTTALRALGLSAEEATDAVGRGVKSALDDLATSFTTGLQSRLNSASGKSFLNDFTALFAQHAQDIADAAALGLSPSLANSVFAKEAQQIVDQAKLTGQAFVDLTSQFPDLVGVVHEATDAIKDQAAAQDALNSSARGVVDYLNSLISGPNSSLSPTDVLANAKSVYNANLALAQGGDISATSQFPQLADNLEKAAKAVYASAQGYQDIRNQIISQGLALPAVQQATDPVVVAVRDAIAAIQATTAAVGGTTTAVGATTTAVGATTTAVGGTTSAVNGLNSTAGQIATNTNNTAVNTGAIGDVVVNTGSTSSQLAGGVSVTGMSAVIANTGNAAINTGLSGLRGDFGSTGFAGNQLDYIASFTHNNYDLNQALSGYTVATATNTGNTATNTGALGNISIVTGNIASNTGTTASNTGDTSSLLNSSNNSGIGAVVINTGNAAVNIGSNDNQGLRALQSTAVSTLNLLNSQFTGGVVTGSASQTFDPVTRQFVSASFTTSNNVLSALSKIVINTYQTVAALNVLHSFGIGAFQGGHETVGVYATGGIIPPHGLGLVREHSPGGPQFLRAGSEPVHVSPYGPSNDDLVPEIRALRGEIILLRRENSAMIEGAARASREDSANVAKTVKDGLDKNAEATRLSKRNQRVAA